jgi:hypothetical protein
MSISNVVKLIHGAFEDCKNRFRSLLRKSLTKIKKK